jgi:hypothetical protein
MFNSRWLVIAAFYSASSLAGVSFFEKEARVKALMKLGAKLPAVTFEGYERELQYEKQGLSLEKRAKAETNLLADQVRRQVVLAYEAALKEHNDPVLAREEVRDSIERDLELAAPKLREEILRLSLATLEAIENGSLVSEPVELEETEVVMLKKVSARSEFLNQDSDPVLPVANKNRDSEKREYKNKAELIESLISNRDSSRFVSNASQTFKTAEIVTAQANISVQVKMEFLGAELEAGPSITFRRSLATDAIIMAEGLNPVILSDGNFDFLQRDSQNKVIKQNGKNLRRYISFTCDVDLHFETDYEGGGGFKYMGIGADASVGAKFANTVTMASRRIALPEYVGGKSVTVKFISELCQRDFTRAKITNNMTVLQVLDVMMKNVISGLRFSHARTKCVSDSDCKNWYNREKSSLERQNNVARCVEHKTEKYRFCQLRGKSGQNCPVYKNGKKVSSGDNEYSCDWGLRCVEIDDDDYIIGIKIESARGQCRK